MTGDDDATLSWQRLEAPGARARSWASVEKRTVFSRTLQRAADVLGGSTHLADHLHVDRAELERWIAGHGEPPLDVFLRAVDVVLLHAERSRGSA